MNQVITVKKGDILELEIESLVFGGKGITSHDGMKVFVEGVAPGDKVRAMVIKKKKNYLDARLEEVLEKSPDRIEPKCVHFDTCGGCKWQFLSYEDQLKIKEKQVVDSLERIGGLTDYDLLPILGSPEEWFYRNKMELSFGPGAVISREELTKEDGTKWEEVKRNPLPMLGFYPPKYHYEVFDLSECHLESEYMGKLVRHMRTFAHQHELSFFDSKYNKGLLRTFTIREGKNTGERMLILTCSMEEFNKKEELIEWIQKWNQEEPKGKVTSLFFVQIDQMKGRKTKSHVHHLWGRESLLETLKLEDGNELKFEILPQAFFQTNTHGAELLYSKVIEMAELSGEELVYDLYCGTGTIGQFCAHKASKVLGVELNESSVESAKENLKLNGIENIEMYCGTVESCLKEIHGGENNDSPKPDVVIVDPPRSGLGDKVVEQCSSYGAKRIVYVSCNPTTLARDLKCFAENGYKMTKLQPVDLFPHTHHVESICVLTQS